MEDKYIDLVKHQNRAIATLRHMMEHGYIITHIPDRNQFSVNLGTGRYALCKYPVPRNKQSGLILFDHYDEAYKKAQTLIWVNGDLANNGEKVYTIEELNSITRKIIVEE